MQATGSTHDGKTHDGKTQDGKTQDGATRDVDDDQPAVKPMFDDAQMRKLRLAVIGMGAVLLLGFTTVIGRIVYLLNRPAVDPSIVAATSPGPAPSDIRLALPAGATVRNLSLSGNRLAVHYDAPSGPGIAIIDLATGRAVQTIAIGLGK